MRFNYNLPLEPELVEQITAYFSYRCKFNHNRETTNEQGAMLYNKLGDKVKIDLYRNYLFSPFLRKF